MGSEIHVAIPCEQRAQRIAHRHSIDEDIGHGNRLHGEWSAVDPAFRDAEERTLEREYAVAVAAGPFRKEDEVVPGIEPSLQRIAVPCRPACPAFDGHGALQPGEKAEQRPVGDLRLGYEAARYQAAQHHDVQIGTVIAGEKRRSDRGTLAPDPAPDSTDAPAEEGIQ